MYIVPNSDIYILKGIEADRSFANVKYFASKQARDNYMLQADHIIYRGSALSYIKQGSVRVGVSADSIYACNYLMYRNTAFGSRWFFAFIDSVEYVNNATSEIRFTIDSFQTWFYDCDLGQCFVEREHVLSDMIGEHTLNEGLDAGELVARSDTKLTSFCNDVIYGCEFTLTDSQLDTIEKTGLVISGPKTYGAVMNGCSYAFTENSDLLLAFVNSIVNSGYTNSIQSIFTIPEALKPYKIVSVGSLPIPVPVDGYSGTINLPTLSTTFGRYTPKNNKLYTYPYSDYLIYSPTGSSFVLQPQFMTGDKTLRLRANTTSRPTLQITPNNYKGAANNMTIGYTLDYGIQGSFNYDSYQAMIASYGTDSSFTEFFKYTLPEITSGVSAITGAIGTGVSIASGDIGGAISGIGGIASSINNVGSALLAESKDKHDTTKLSGSSGNNMLWQTKTLEVYCQVQNCKEEIARMIDDYFTMFGYKVNKMKVPNISGRKAWNYVKCQTLNVTGDIPSDVVPFLESVFMSGVTFWKTKIGDYSADNSL